MSIAAYRGTFQWYYAILAGQALSRNQFATGAGTDVHPAAVYLLVSVIPFVAPFAIALWLHRGLRRQILLLGGAPAARTAAPEASSKRRATSRRQAAAVTRTRSGDSHPSD